MIYGKACHLPLGLEQKPFWDIKKCNLDYDDVGIVKKLQLQELEEIQNYAYENARFTKKRPSVFMTECLQERNFMLKTKSFFIIHI